MNTGSSRNLILEESLTSGWDLLKQTFWPYFCMLGLAGFLCFLPDFARDGIKYAVSEDRQLLFGGLLVIASILVKGMMNLGLINIQLRILDNKPFTSNDLWAPAGKFWAWCGASVCASVLIGVGFCFLIVPGVILAIMFQFYPYFLVDKRLGPIQALRASAAITAGSMWDLFFLGLILGFARLIGFCLLFIGSVPAHMFSELTMTHVYRALLASTEQEKLSFLNGSIQSREEQS